MNSGVPLSDLKNKFLSEFTDFESALNGDATNLRRQAIDQFDQLGFPTLKNEDWKYTNISKYVDETWSQRISKTLSKTSQVFENLRGFSIPFVVDAHKLVFCDGIFSPDLSEIKSDDPSIVISSFSE